MGERVRPSRNDETVELASRLLAAKQGDVSWAGIRSKLIERGATENTLHEGLDILTRAGLVETMWKRDHSDWKLRRVRILDQAALDEYARPGRLTSLAAAIREESVKLPATAAAERLLEFLRTTTSDWDAETVRWAARLVRHAASGQQVLPRQFSGSWDLSKKFEEHRSRIERVLGDVSDLGVIDSASLLYVAGPGVLHFAEATIQVSPILGILGFERGVLRTIKEVDAEKVVYIENKQVFEAVAKGMVPELIGYFCIFTGGNAGAAIRHVASVTRGECLVWADLDPEGVRIARQIHTATNGRARPYRMTPRELEAATHKLDATRLKTLDQELGRPGPLHDLLLAIKHSGTWLEQEKQLPRAGGSEM